MKIQRPFFYPIKSYDSTSRTLVREIFFCWQKMMYDFCMKKFVLTGRPGIGKTTLIELLASKGCEIIGEACISRLNLEMALKGGRCNIKKRRDENRVLIVPRAVVGVSEQSP